MNLINQFEQQADQQRILKEEDAYHSHLVPEELPYDFQQATEAQAAMLPRQISDATKLGLSLLIAALLAGVAGNLLIHNFPWGLNVTVWVGIVAALIALLIRRRGQQVLGAAKWLTIPVLFFAATFAWRDSPTLNALSLLSLVLLCSMLALRVRIGKLALSGVWDHLQSLIFGSLFILLGPAFLIFSDTKWRELPSDGWSKKSLAIGRGLALAAPLLLVFGGLFAAADEVFQNLLARTFNVDASVVVTHLFLTGLFAWITAGFLRLLFISTGMIDQAGTGTVSLSLGIIETATVIGLLDALFLAFVLVQFRYFFGGKTNIPSGRGVEYAEYARHGFFELVWVSVLVLPLLLGAHWLLRKDNPAHERIFRILAGIKIALLAVIMVSAMQRMRLYQSECGLTELRVYTMAFMIWLAIVFVWFAVTVLRGQRERFAFGAIIIGLAMIAALHFVNPDALIARVNFQRAREGKSFDASYTSSLSADALPTVMANLPTVKAEDQKIIQEQIKQRWDYYNFGGWRSWNWARLKGKRALAAKQ